MTDYKMTQDDADRLRMEQSTRELAAADVGLAEELFNAYNEEGPHPWKTFDGRDVPRWHAINDAVRAKWTAAARRARAMFGGGR